jgi:hypothetical protein
MKIINKTDLPYEMIGKLIDMTLKQDIGSTHYVGQVLYGSYEVNSREVKVIIRYLKKYVEWRFSYENKQ